MAIPSLSLLAPHVLFSLSSLPTFLFLLLPPLFGLRATYLASGLVQGSRTGQVRLIGGGGGGGGIQFIQQYHKIVHRDSGYQCRQLKRTENSGCYQNQESCLTCILLINKNKPKENTEHSSNHSLDPVFASYPDVQVSKQYIQTPKKNCRIDQEWKFFTVHEPVDPQAQQKNCRERKRGTNQSI